MDLFSLIQRLIDDGTIQRMVTDPRIQFGPPNRQLLGATLLPERMIDDVRGEESEIRYRTVIANDGTRYSPVQIKTPGQLVGTFKFEVGHQDIGAELTSREYDALRRLLERNLTLDASTTVLRFVDSYLVRPLSEVIEKQRWQAIVNAQVDRVGDGGYTETVEYPNPEGHRMASGGDWTDDSYDPIEDIFSVVDMMEDKGQSVDSVWTSRRVAVTVTRNENVRRRYANVRVLSDEDMFARMSLPQLNAGLMSDGLPPLRTYDVTYATQDGGRFRFLPEGTIVFVSETGRDETIMLDEPEEEERFRILENTLGYTAVAPAAGQSDPGRVAHLRVITDSKPPRVEGEAWQATLPVITEPEAIAVIHSIFESNGEGDGDGDGDGDGGDG